MPFFLAAQATGQKQAESALGTVLEYGLLGAICVLLLFALIYVTRALLKEKDDRREDQSKMATARENDNKALQALTIEMKEHAAQQQVEATRTQDAVRNVLENQKDALGEVERALNTLQQEQVRLASNLPRRQV